MKLIGMLCILLFLPSLAIAEGSVGNGGGYEVEFVSISNEIGSWMKKALDSGTLVQKLHLSQGTVSAADLYSAFTKYGGQNLAIVKFQDDPIILAGYSTAPAGRVCGNDSHPARILCNNSLWLQSSPQIKYTIVLHEILGVAGIEKNNGEYSQYPISQYILPFVQRSDKYELSDTASQNNSLEFVSANYGRCNQFSIGFLYQISTPSGADQVQFVCVKDPDHGGRIHAYYTGTSHGLVRLITNITRSLQPGEDPHSETVQAHLIEDETTLRQDFDGYETGFVPLSPAQKTSLSVAVEVDNVHYGVFLTLVLP